MNNRLTSYQLQDFAEEDGNSVFSDPDYVVASPPAACSSQCHRS